MALSQPVVPETRWRVQLSQSVLSETRWRLHWDSREASVDRGQGRSVYDLQQATIQVRDVRKAPEMRARQAVQPALVQTVDGRLPSPGGHVRAHAAVSPDGIRSVAGCARTRLSSTSEVEA